MKHVYTIEEITSFLLGGSAESEQDAFADAILADTDLFAKVEERETELIDAYVRGRLDAPLRTRFEYRQAVNPALGRRVSAAKQLLPKLEQSRLSHAAPLGWRQSLIAAWQAQAIASRFAWAAVLLLFLPGLIWLLYENRRLRDSIDQLQSAQSRHAERERHLAEQAEEQRNRNSQLLAELDQLRNQSAAHPIQLKPSPSLIASLKLNAYAVSADGASRVPRIHFSARDKSFRLILDTLAGKQPKYRLSIVTAAESRLVFETHSIRPANPLHSRFTLIVPTSVLPKGEYIVTVDGLDKNDSVTILSANFIVE